MTETKFSDLGLKPELLSAVQALGFESPSPIQAKAVPAILEGGDIIGLSETGSGKTAAFTLPALQMIDLQARHPQVLILSPTRELSVQVCEEAHRLGKDLDGLRTVPVYGGTPIDRQIRSLKGGAQLVVGTPGRLLDHMRRRTLNPRNIQLVVLDEADRMLDMGFREEMEELLSAMPESRQTLFFSATMNKHVERLIKKFGKDPIPVSVERKTKTVSTISQCYYEVRNRSKVEVLSRLLDIEPPRLAVIFCNTKRSVDECTESLLARGYTADRLHGDISQQLRDRTMQRFREGKIELLVATDVAARGLDVDDVEAVFNYDLPQDPEDYVHRIGRTGRAGRKGRAISFIYGRDVYRLQSIEKYTRQQIQRMDIPSQEQVEGHRADKLFEEVKEQLAASPNQTFRHYIDRLLDQGYAPTEIASTLFEMLRKKLGREGEFIAEDSPNYTSKKPTRPNKRDRERRGRRDDDRGGRERRERRDFDKDPRSERGEGDPRPRMSRDKPGGRQNRIGNRPGSSCLFLGVGKSDGVQPGEIIGMIYRESKIEDGAVGQVLLFERHTLVQIKEECAPKVIKACRSSKLAGRNFKIDFDRQT
ncbi:DEAD/DEAH box helicase [Persicirhabdus sediminis]|uniref:RNA helicase n=1 Tax=Persicirhabdus sediminis TaxID=454144 RepID=A0A8J7MCG7_9BACT|nr:DEAD/DEAH box helicase [Persicirhabdus sediminis]MBK1789922.1 DEAD/DEAH box helicase [Persicirhabdus sediminis]